jgi:hypothetical protein
MDTRAAAVARRAAEACGLSWAHVAVAAGTGDPQVLFVDAAPDLPAWNAVTDGAALVSLAEHLAHTALRPQGVLP